MQSVEERQKNKQESRNDIKKQKDSDRKQLKQKIKLRIQIFGTPEEHMRKNGMQFIFNPIIRNGDLYPGHILEDSILLRC